MKAIVIGSQKVTLGPTVGRGGEGEVFQLVGRPGQAVKIYEDRLRSSREPKVRAMVEGKLAGSTDLVAFPAEVAFDTSGRFAGFVMRLVTGFQPVHQLYSPKSRRDKFPKADYRFLARAAQNVARAVGRVHQSGCVIGDLNHSGVLISADATAALIDADSFQFSAHGKDFPCVVGVPDFTPPELQGRNLSTVTRTRAHDNFGLAIAIFQLLVMGRHPYAGKHQGKALTISEAIQQNRFAFSRDRKSEVRADPPPNTLVLSDFPVSIAKAFEAAFGRDPAKRPEASAWVSLLGELERSLNRCSTVKTHYYPAAAGKCVWCELGKQTALDMFPDLVAPTIPLGGTFNIGRIVQDFRSLVLPELESILPKFSGSPSSAFLNKHKPPSRVAAIVLGAILIGAMVGGLANYPGAWFLWLAGALFSFFGLIKRQQDHSKVLAAYREVDAKARQEEEAFIRRSGLSEMHLLRADIARWIDEYQGTDDHVKYGLIHLQRTRRERHLHAYLDRFQIRQASISGIGPGRTAELISFGVETAADITISKVKAVPGFGDVLAGRLMDWRRQKEAGFRYTDTPDASDRQAEQDLRSKVANRKAELQGKIISGVDTLKKFRSKASGLQSNPALMRALADRADGIHALQKLGVKVPSSPPLNVVVARSPAVPAAPPVSPWAQPISVAAAANTSPSCPQCGSRMIRRTAKRGRNSGNSFWGCSQYPSCRGTRS